MKDSKKVYPWSDIKQGPFKHSKRNWMPEGVVKANEGAILVYQSVEGIDRVDNKLNGLSVRYRGDKI